MATQNNNNSVIASEERAKQSARLVPQLRFKEFDGEWERKKLGELGQFKGGGTPSTQNDEFWNGTIPWISSSDIIEDDIHNINISRFLNEKGIEESATKLIPKESILFVSRVGVGKLAINKVDICTSQDFANLIASKADSYFVGYLFVARNKLLHSYSQGTSIKGFTVGDLKSIPIKIPSLKEQQKIATFLTAVDDKISQLTSKKEQLTKYKKGVMQQLFSQELRFQPDSSTTSSKQPSLRGAQQRSNLPDENSPSTSNENQFPDWEEKRLGEVVNLKKGEQLNKIELTEDAKYASMSGGINPSGYTNKWNTLENTIIISEGGNSCGHINFMIQKFWCGGHCYSLLDVNKNINILFLFQALKFNESKIMRLRVGSGLPNIQKKDLSVFKLKIPSLKEQQKIASYLSALDDKIEAVQVQIEQTQEFKKGLLQQLFV